MASVQLKIDDKNKSASKTITDTVTGQHEHTIVGYSLVKGIGDGEPIASERFTVGGHEWVLLFYPDGKRSSSTEGVIAPGGGAAGGVAAQQHMAHIDVNAANPAGDGPPAAAAAAPAAGAQALEGGNIGQRAVVHIGNQQQAVIGYPQGVQQHPAHRRELANEYAALFVALIGESENPQGVVNTSEGRVVRAFHRFTLVDQSCGGRDLSKGRRRDQGAVKISCARQDPNARNCHGYRKFVKRSVLESVGNGYLVNDTIIIRYTIELVVSSGGALSKQPSAPVKVAEVQVPPPTVGKDLAVLLESGEGADVTFRVEDEALAGHKIILSCRSPVFQALLNSEMREGKEGIVQIQDVRAPVFRALLYFVYTDMLPEELEGAGLDVAMAQHLLVAADRYQLGRLRRICEHRLCETVEASTVAVTLTLAEQNHAEELKRVCLEFVSKNLTVIMSSDGYRDMINSCPSLQTELLNLLAERNVTAERNQRKHPRDHNTSDGPQEAEVARRVRQRRD